MAAGPLGRLPFKSVWAVDFEFIAPAGERPDPVCLVAHELKSGKRIRVWRNGLLAMPAPPYPVDDDALFVAFFASAELNCHLALGWPMPTRILDLYVERRAATNGLPTPMGNSLLGALAAHGLSTISAGEKDHMRDLIMSGGPWEVDDQTAILDYCESDVVALGKLLPKMLPAIDLPRALLRGRYMAAVARMEFNGIPIDTHLLDAMRDGWAEIKLALIEEIDGDYGVFEVGAFKRARFAYYLTREGIPWPRLPSGVLDLKDDTFKTMSKQYPQLVPLRELRVSLSKLRLNDIGVGVDERHRCLLSPFSSRSGRNQPSNSKFIFGPSAWIRSLIKPRAGDAVAYVDWSAQEVGIAAALSGDANLKSAYLSGDPYMAFGKQIGLIPPAGTKVTHKAERDRLKAVVLGVNYGMGAETLAARIEDSPAAARNLLLQHREAYPKFWTWSQAVMDQGMLNNIVTTVFGWPLHVGPGVNPRSLMNFPMQANGAEMMRLACCLATEAGVKVCAPVHDALMIEANAGQIDDAVALTRECMAEASRIVLDGFELRTDAKIIRWPDRYVDGRGVDIWRTVTGLLAKAERNVA